MIGGVRHAHHLGETPYMLLLAVKALAAPALMAMCAFACTRWGAVVGGWLLGLPLVSGPVSYFLLVQHGSRFAENAALGTLLGMVGTGVFCVGYALTSKGRPWWQSLTLSGAASVAMTVALTRLHPDLPAALLFAVVFLGLMMLVIGRPEHDAAVPSAKLHVLFVRMAVASAVVVGVTLASTELGPQISGTLTAIPVISAIMAVSTHRSGGSDSVRGLMRGAVAGLWGGAAFFAVVALLVTGWAPAITYLAATVAAAVVAMVFGRAMSSRRLAD
jgi:hypothetical protein